MKKQLAILDKELELLRKNAEVEAVLLIGSVAYGTATEESDLDLIVICNENKFVSKYVDDIMVEIHYHKFNTLIKSLETNPFEIYKYIYSKIIFDNGCKLAKLICKANKIYEHYITPAKEIKDIQYWLSSTKIKLISAINSNDELKISYLISTNTWKVLEGVWAKNNKPMPPSSIAYTKHNELQIIPFEFWFEDLLNSDCKAKANTMIKIIDWICKND